MAIPAQQREFLARTLVNRIGEYYGDKVPTLGEYVSRKRATYKDRLRKDVNAASLEGNISGAISAVGTAQGVITNLTNNKSNAIDAAKADRDEAIAKASAAYEKRLVEIGVHYNQSIEEAREKHGEARQYLDDTARAAYFSALGEEDDGRRVWLNDPKLAVDQAISARVDAFIEHNLGDDELGRQVRLRMKEETNIQECVWLANNINELRDSLLSFIRDGKLPGFTMESWGIENGIDIR